MKTRLLKKMRKEIKLVENKKTGLFEVFGSHVYFYSNPESYKEKFGTREEAEECRRQIILDSIR